MDNKVLCSKCASMMLIRKGPKGNFYGCSKYPSCKNTMSITNTSETNISTINCSKCGSIMIKRTSSRGNFYGCSNYPNCKNTISIENSIPKKQNNENQSSYNNKDIWNLIISKLINKNTELATIPGKNMDPLWFIVYMVNNDIFVYNSKQNKPSTKMSHPRKITKEEFLNVYPYYVNWTNGLHIARSQSREISQNTSYIFAILKTFDKQLVCKL